MEMIVIAPAEPCEKVAQIDGVRHAHERSIPQDDKLPSKFESNYAMVEKYTYTHLV